MSLPDRACLFAKSVHRIQMYGPLPYEAHLAHVVGTLLRFGHDDDALLAAAWLHDSVEDGHTTLPYIKDHFGEGIAALVDAVTNEPGKNRRERHDKTYPKLAKAGPHAITLKLADRIANTEASILAGDSKYSMYEMEYANFRAALLSAGGAIDMWEYLDRLMHWTGAAPNE